MTITPPSPADLPVTRLSIGGERPRQLALRIREGEGPAVVWLGGFRSDMRATKAAALDAWAADTGRRMVRFDYSGHGESDGRFEDGTISDWLADAEAVIAAHAGERPILVGSSMGGWIACLAARNRARQGGRIGGMVLIAPALDFTEELMWASFTPEIRETLARDGVWYRPTDYASEPDPIRMALIEDGRRHLLLGENLEPGGPVHILQGMRDPDVPYAHALRILERLPAEGTRLTLVKDADHRLSRPQDIELLVRTVEAMAREA
ncbi:alpha/beta hydrolase [Methylorubrum salsuginis]|uniref:Palmitoyl-protein thioesterase ABHD10, mitochondrial n=1 Tax=Methylorubrum salsuginis TaxID=414703 RepID=A0A1I4GJH0_9HYPH|nr:alpha/beta hydrolase [Methylorubrum salsuginis]SFL29660.1 Pimeloyl-ACP methyl ester carboxylesterase [Methylorubrum salsuginis]